MSSFDYYIRLSYHAFKGADEFLKAFILAKQVKTENACDGANDTRQHIQDVMMTGIYCGKPYPQHYYPKEDIDPS